jgi:sporulation protein YlmC with PRC-barrel domain
MHLKIKQLYGCILDATDGKIGHVKDIYFDDDTWEVRYIIANTGSWLSELMVLISPKAFGDFHQDGRLLTVNLSKEQIEQSPPITSQKPISKQREDEYHRYDGWPEYWTIDPVFGMNGLQSMVIPVRSPGEPEPDRPKPVNKNLRSALAVDGYKVQASDGTIGHVTDFLVDTHSWKIREIIVKPSTWFSKESLEIPVVQVERIDYYESTILVKVTKASFASDSAAGVS